MQPLDPNDPLWKLLGQARPVEPRGNFVQNVVRAARSVPQDRGWLACTRAKLAEWLGGVQRPALLAASAALVLALAATLFVRPHTDPALTVADAPAVPALAEDDLALIADDLDLSWDNLDHMDSLVAMDDTSALTDREIAFLLY